MTPWAVTWPRAEEALGAQLQVAFAGGKIDDVFLDAGLARGPQAQFTKAAQDVVHAVEEAPFHPRRGLSAFLSRSLGKHVTDAAQENRNEGRQPARPGKIEEVGNAEGDEKHRFQRLDEVHRGGGDLVHLMGHDRVDLALVVAGEEADIRVEKLAAEPGAQAQLRREHEAETRDPRKMGECQRGDDRGHEKDDVACCNRRTRRKCVDGEDHARAGKAGEHRIDEDGRAHQFAVPDQEGKKRQKPACAFARSRRRGFRRCSRFAHPCLACSRCLASPRAFCRKEEIRRAPSHGDAGCLSVVAGASGGLRAAWGKAASRAFALLTARRGADYMRHIPARDTCPCAGRRSSSVG